MVRAVDCSVRVAIWHEERRRYGRQKGCSVATRKNGAAVGLEDVLLQAKITNRLLAHLLKRKPEEATTQQEIVKLLASTGATSQQIAEILDTSSNTVRKAQMRLARPAKA